jgi:hypothetical protein
MPLPSWVSVGVQVFSRGSLTSLEDRRTFFRVQGIEEERVFVVQFGGGQITTLTFPTESFGDVWMNEEEARRALITQDSPIYSSTEPEYVGRIPVRQELPILPVAGEVTVSGVDLGYFHSGDVIQVTGSGGAASRVLVSTVEQGSDRNRVVGIAINPEALHSVFDSLPRDQILAFRHAYSRNNIGLFNPDSDQELPTLPVGYRFPQEVLIQCSGVNLNPEDSLSISLLDSTVTYSIVGIEPFLEGVFLRANRRDETRNVNLPDWVEVGAIVAPRENFTGEHYQITSIRDGEVGLSNVNLTILDFGVVNSSQEVAFPTVEDLTREFTLLQRAIPEWFREGAVINLIFSTDLFTITNIDRVGSYFTIQDSDGQNTHVYLTQLGNWEPYRRIMPSSLTEWIPTREGTPIVSNVSTKLPPWIEVGKLVRTRSKPRRVLRVSRIDSSLHQVSFQRVVQTTPDLKVSEVETETIDFKQIHTLEELTPEGIPTTEFSCPYCHKTGIRDKEREASNPFGVHAYQCETKHRWNYSANGSLSQGDLTPLTRFERLQDI